MISKLAQFEQTDLGKILYDDLLRVIKHTTLHDYIRVPISKELYYHKPLEEILGPVFAYRRGDVDRILKVDGEITDPLTGGKILYESVGWKYFTDLTKYIIVKVEPGKDQLNNLLHLMLNFAYLAIKDKAISMASEQRNEITEDEHMSLKDMIAGDFIDVLLSGYETNFLEYYLDSFRSDIYFVVSGITDQMFELASEEIGFDVSIDY